MPSKITVLLLAAYLLSVSHSFLPAFAPSYWQRIADRKRLEPICDSRLKSSRSIINAAESKRIFEKMNAEKENKTIVPRSSYKRAELWEQEMKDQSGTMTWEEKVQFEGQMHGNKFRQNEILRKHLGSF